MLSRHVRPLHLLAYCEGEAEPEVRNHVQRHLEQCELCRRRHERALRGIEFARQVLTVEMHGEPRAADGFEFDPSLCRCLLEECYRAVLDDPARAVALAEGAVQIAEGRAAGPGEFEGAGPLRARCWAALGNARRVLGELSSAEEAFNRAHQCLAEDGAGDLRALAELANLMASLRRHQRQFDEALLLHDQALGWYRELGDSHHVGRSLINKAKTLEERYEVEGAARLLRDAAGLIDGSLEPRLLLCARMNLVVLLIESGHFAEAEALLPEVHSLVDAVHNPLDLVRLTWAEGKIALRLGRRDLAEASFRSVQQEMFRRGMAYDAALVSLDLAILYAQEGCTAELKRLAAEILPVFESRDVRREAMAVLLMFRQAVEEERLTLELARQLASLLQRDRRQPEPS